MNLEQQNSLKIGTTEARLLEGFKITGLRGISSARDMSMLKQLSALFSTILPYGRGSAALQLLFRVQDLGVIQGMLTVALLVCQIGSLLSSKRGPALLLSQ